MMKIEKNVLVTHTCAQMFDLVDQVLEYPQFLPWCKKTEIIKRENNELIASVYMDYLKISQHFTTHNFNTPNELIKIHLVNGPFRKLAGTWKFTPLGEIGCKIEFTLEYEFANTLLETIIGPVFRHISQTLVDCFIQEADKRYGV